MSYFASADEVYRTLGRLLQDAATSGGLGAQLQQTNTSVLFALSDPAASIALTVAGNDPVVAFDAAEQDGALTLEMSADTAHEIFLGKLSLYDATDAERLVMSGSTESFVELWPTTMFVLPPRYTQILAAAGRAELADIEVNLPIQDPSLLTRRL